VDTAVGIDLSGLSRRTKGRTALAQLSVEDRPRLLDRQVYERGEGSDLAVAGWVLANSPRVVAIDAPLTLPHAVTCSVPGCLRCRPGSAPHQLRDVDTMVKGMPTSMLAAIAFRGIYLARQFREAGIKVIETYPAGSYRRLGADRNDTAAMDRALSELIAGFAAESQDERDAVAAGLAAAQYAGGRGVKIEGADGEIWLVSP